MARRKRLKSASHHVQYLSRNDTKSPGESAWSSSSVQITGLTIEEGPNEYESENIVLPRVDKLSQTPLNVFFRPPAAIDVIN